MQKMLGKNYLVFTFLCSVRSIATISSKSTEVSGRHGFNNDTLPAVHVVVTNRAKFNGKVLKRSNVVPIKSHVTLTCKVLLKKNKKMVFNLMLVSFSLPSGEQVVPANCAVDMKHNCKRCRLVIKEVSLSDQGKYRCHVHYASGENIVKEHDDIFLYVRRKMCPAPKVFCHEARKCVASPQQCDTYIRGQEMKRTSAKKTQYSKERNKMKSMGYALYATGMLLITVFILLLVIWVKRKRQVLEKQNKMNFGVPI